jgi:hypothetical protein
MMMMSLSRRRLEPCFIRSAESITMAGPSESVLMATFEVRIFSRSKKKFNKKRLARHEYVRPRIWTVVHRYATSGRTQLDAKDINFDMYKRASEFMELSGMRMLPEQELQAGNCIYGNLFCRQAQPPIDSPFANLDAHSRAMAILDCAMCGALDSLDLPRLHYINSNVSGEATLNI